MWLALGAAGVPMLSACRDQIPAGTTSGEAPWPLARPDEPVEWDISESNPPIDDGLAPETGGTFNILNYADYMAPGVMKAFSEKWDVAVEVTPFTNYDEMSAKMREPGAAFDLVVPGPSQLGKLVYTELLQPLNHSYLPNLVNVWPNYLDPWYDLGARYTVPYTVYTTGVGYRADIVSDPSVGYEMMWDADYEGKIYLLDDMSESISMSLLRNDITKDVNTGDPTFLAEATNSLTELVGEVNAKFSISAYTLVPEGQATVHQAWSGDMIAAQWYLPKGETPDVLGFWSPESESDTVIGNDVLALPKSASKPVLGHALINDLLDNDISLRNFGFNGYQPPITKLSAQYLTDEGYIPANLQTAVVVPADFDKGLTFYETGPATTALWLTNWAVLKSGA